MTQYYQYAITLTGTKQEAAIDFLKEVSNIKYMLYADDTSDADNKHKHIYVVLTKRWSINQISIALKNISDSIAYCKNVINKKGYVTYIQGKKNQGHDVSSWGEVPPHAAHVLETGRSDSFSDKSGDVTCTYKLCNDKYTTREEAIEDFKQRASSDWVFRNAAVMAAINRVFPVAVRTQKYTLNQFNAPRLDFSNNKTKIIVGPTNIGKTQYACAHFDNPLVITQKEDWSKYNPDVHDGAVIDDMTFCKNNPVTMLHTIDMREPATFRVLYGVVVVPAGFPRIFTCNSEDLFWPENAAPETMEAYHTRSEVIHFVDGYKLHGSQTEWGSIKPTAPQKKAVVEKLYDLPGGFFRKRSSDETEEEYISTKRRHIEDGIRDEETDD